MPSVGPWPNDLRMNTVFDGLTRTSISIDPSLSFFLRPSWGSARPMLRWRTKCSSRPFRLDPPLRILVNLTYPCSLSLLRHRIRSSSICPIASAPLALPPPLNLVTLSALHLDFASIRSLLRRPFASALMLGSWSRLCSPVIRRPQFTRSFCLEQRSMHP
jgi:hypothetical protein